MDGTGIVREMVANVRASAGHVHSATGGLLLREWRGGQRLGLNNANSSPVIVTTMEAQRIIATLLKVVKQAAYSRSPRSPGSRGRTLVLTVESAQ